MHPSWRYHRTQPAHIVTTEAADAALGAGWGNTPAPWHNVAADCCDVARAEHGRRHTEDCAFGLPEPEGDPDPQSSPRHARRR